MSRVRKAGGRHTKKRRLLKWLFICVVLAAGLFSARTDVAFPTIVSSESNDAKSVEQPGTFVGNDAKSVGQPGTSVGQAETSVEQPGTSVAQPETPASGIKDSEEKYFSVTFLDVGQGDAAFVSCDGSSMLIDGGKGDQSDKIYAFLKERGISYLDYIVATHPDDDHIGGLSGALNYAAVGRAFSPVEDDDTATFQNFKKYLERRNIGITIPQAGEKFSLGSASFTVLGPKEITDSDNNNSIVLKIEHGGNTFLFTGDAEKKEEGDLLRSKEDLNSTVLKIGHHGSASSTGDEFLDAVDPAVAVISCGKNNEYGHPAADILKKLKEREIAVLRTDLQGDIRFVEIDGEIRCEVDRNPDADVFVPGASEKTAAQPVPLEATGRDGDAGSADESAVTRNAPDDNAPGKQVRDYIINIRTGKFHFPGCRGVTQMKEKNKKYVTCDRQDLLDQGYESCGICRP